MDRCSKASLEDAVDPEGDDDKLDKPKESEEVETLKVTKDIKTTWFDPEQGRFYLELGIPNLSL